MALVDYLGETTICTNLAGKDRDEAVRSLLERFVTGKMLGKDTLGTALTAVLDREKLGSTAIGNGVAVPHARIKEIKGVLVAFGFSREGVEFNALDRSAVHMIFLVLGPKEGADDYLTVLQHISKLVQNGDFRRFVSRARTGRDVVELIREMDV